MSWSRPPPCPLSARCPPQLAINLTIQTAEMIMGGLGRATMDGEHVQVAMRALEKVPGGEPGVGVDLTTTRIVAQR